MLVYFNTLSFSILQEGNKDSNSFRYRMKTVGKQIFSLPHTLETISCIKKTNSVNQGTIGYSVHTCLFRSIQNYREKNECLILASCFNKPCILGCYKNYKFNLKSNVIQVVLGTGNMNAEKKGF